VLTRARRQETATLFITGRDFEERELAMQFDKQSWHWAIIGDAERVRLSQERQAVINCLEDASEPLTPRQLAEELVKKPGSVRKLLRGMARDGQVSDHHGKYTLAATGGTSGNSGNALITPPNGGQDDATDRVTNVTGVTAAGGDQATTRNEETVDEIIRRLCCGE
jgi:hypothetical protein